mmetsp:Transcript_7507/g.8629  ORF Transcript_7507/g.8629 Transcript_7507/m.8629 type:complete len:317 (+) Transcript_7507:44-994(+)
MLYYENIAMSTQSVLLNCRPLAQKLLLQAQHGLKGAAARPSVAMIAVGGSEKDYGYPHKHARKTAESLGIEWKSRYLANDAAENEVLAAIASLNADSSVTGIVLHRPFPDRLSLKTLQQAVNPEKDVEGMHPSSLGQVVYQGSRGMHKGLSSILWPCTAKAAVETLKHAIQNSSTPTELKGLEILVIGTSDVLAKPVCSLLHAEGATVTTCPPDLANLSAHTRAADVVISAVSSGPKLITGEMIKPGSIVIDLGINKIPVAGKSRNANAETSYKVVGDVDTHSVLPIAASLSNLAGGIGIVRTSILMNNIVTSILK